MPSSAQVFTCGRLEVDLGQRELRAAGSPVFLGDRAFDILEVLVRSAGALVTKAELMRRVWPGAVVGDNTLEVHISALRRALGSDRGLLKTAYARGYRLLGSWSFEQRDMVTAHPPELASDLPAVRPARNNLPVAGSALIGRSAAVHLLGELLSEHRLLTLSGVGGIGKTRLALEAARVFAASSESNVWFVDLATLSDPGLVPSAVARALGLRLPGAESSAESVARAIGAAATLLLLDNCEHVVDAAATMADAIVRLCPHSTVLATSREVLRVDGEHIYRVPPLDLPAMAGEPSQLLDCSAAQLFVARAKALNPSFSPEQDDVHGIAAICRRLDGIPLAIEFAAARAATIGVEQVASGLTDRFGLLTIGRRTALPRHSTLRSALDWSYDLLPETEAAVLRRLGVFAGDFSLDAAVAVAGELASRQVVDCVAGLVSKSLVVADLRNGTSHYRLLETVRAYALEKLRAAGENADAARRHAEHYRALSARAEAEFGSRAEADWLARYAWHLDNWRAALDWAFSSGGDAAIGVALTVGALPIWFKVSFMDECRRRVEQALACTVAEADPAATMRLTAALAAALFYTDKGAIPEVAAAWERVLATADRLDDTEHRLWARWGLWAYQLNHGAFRDALRSARHFSELAVEPADLAAGDRMIGISLHFLGMQTKALRSLEAVLARPVGAANRSMSRIHLDPKLAARAYLPRILWLQGWPDRAMHAAENVVRDAHDAGLAHCLALVQAGCFVALLAGDQATLRRFTAMLIEQATTHGLGFFCAEGRCFEAILQALQGDADGAHRAFRAATQDLHDYSTTMNVTGYLAGMAGALAGTNAAQPGAAMVEEALARSELHGDRWCMPELLRLRAEFLLRTRAPGAAAAAEAQFRQALGWARRQRTPSWELRVAMSLTTLMLSQGRAGEARALLTPVYRSFEEGFATADLAAAARILDSVD